MSSTRLINISKSFGEDHIINRINLDIEQGEFVVFVGPSGCGKSTLLRMIAGLEDISGGDLYIDDRIVNDVPPVDRGVGMVFQTYALYPHMTVAENIGFGLKLKKVKKHEIARKVNEVGELLQLTDLLEKKPAALSGGQRQRVAIGRCIVRNPNIYLFDEPLSNLDAELRAKMRVEITKLHRKLKATMIYVTHDQVEAMTLADKIVVLNKGGISQLGKPMDLYLEPDNIFVAGFLGSPKMNFLKATVVSVEDDHLMFEIHGSDIQGHLCVPVKGYRQPITERQILTIGIRPEDLRVGNDPQNLSSFSSAVIALENLGNTAYAYLQSIGSDNSLIIKITEEDKIQPEQRVQVQVKAIACHIFDDQGQKVVDVNRNGVT